MSFQPFVVQCLTCGSQLRVTDPAIVGTIATCPKCHSMVQIDPPSKPLGSGKPLGSSEPLGRDVAGRGVAGGNQGGPQVAVGGSSIDSQAITEEAISASEGASLGANDAASGFEGGESNAPPHEFDGEPTPPDWQSDRTRRSRQIALVAALSLTSLLVAIAGFSWFVQSWRKQASNPQQAPTQPPNQPQPLSAAADSAVPPGSDPETTGEHSGVDPTANDPESAGQERLPEGSSAIQSTDAPKETGASDASEGTATSPTQAPSTASLPTRPTDSSALADLIPRSPLEIDPPTTDPPTTRSPPAPQVPDTQSNPGAEQTDTESAALQELPPELAKYTRFLLEEGSNEPTTLEAPPTMDDVTMEAAADELDDPAITVRPKELNLKADLALRMAIDTRGYPLPDLVLLVSQITGVPIQIDWVSFDLAGVELDQPRTAPQGWQTAQEILDTVSESLGGEVRDEDSLAVITLTDETFNERLALLTNLADFGEGEATAKGVLIDFLRGEGEEPGTELSLGVTREEQQVAAIAVEVLRRMRAVEPKVADERLSRWAWCSNNPSGEWAILDDGITIPQPDTPLAMADFLRRIARANETSNLINWYDFNRRAVAPERLLIPHIEADAGTTLQGVLEPLGLQARRVDAHHWWLGRESTYDRLPAIVWTPPLGELRDRFVNELANVMSGANRDAFRVTIDPQSDRAMMLLPRFVVRQLSKLAEGVAAKP